MTDDALVAETKRLAALERRSTAELLSLLIEFERRALHLTLGFSSLFEYCTRALLLSEQAAYSRITAARLAKRYPEVLQHLTAGTLTLSSVGILAPHLTDDNVAPMLEAARHKSTRDVERLIAALHPQPDIPASIRALPSAKAVPVTVPRARHRRFWSTSQRPRPRCRPYQRRQLSRAPSSRRSRLGGTCCG